MYIEMDETYGFLLFGPGRARCLGGPSFKAPRRLFWPGLGPPSPFLFPSGCVSPSAMALSGVGSVVASGLASALTSAAGEGSLTAGVCVELDSEGGDFVDDALEAVFSCGNCSSVDEGTLRMIVFDCFDFAPREVEPAPLCAEFDDIVMSDYGGEEGWRWKTGLWNYGGWRPTVVSRCDGMQRRIKAGSWPSRPCKVFD